MSDLQPTLTELFLLLVIFGFFVIAINVAVQKLFYDLTIDDVSNRLQTFKGSLARMRGKSSDDGGDDWGALAKEILGNVAVNLLSNNPKVKQVVDQQVNNITDQSTEPE